MATANGSLAKRVPGLQKTQVVEEVIGDASSSAVKVRCRRPRMTTTMMTLEVCGLMMSPDCRHRGGVAEAKTGFVAVLDDVPAFVCDDCARLVKAHMVADS
jgi:hypothetical protein